MRASIQQNTLKTRHMVRTTGRRRLLAAAAAAALSSVALWSAAAGAAAAAGRTTTTVPVGVVLDLASDVGRSSLAGISMALEQFYVKNPSYGTRVELHVRDSRGDPAHAAEDLIKNARVQVIIVAPQTSAEADQLAQLGVWLAVWMEETDLGRYCVSATRREHLDSIHNISFDGLARKFKLVNGELQLPLYEIANHTSKAQMGVVLWILPLSLLPQNLSLFDSSRSGSGTIEPLFWQEDPVMASRGRERIVFPLMLDPKPSLNPEYKRRELLGRDSGMVCSDNNTNKKPLRIGVPKKDGFRAFVNVSRPYFSCKDNSITHPINVKQITGYSIDIFETAMKQLKHPRCYEFCVFDGSYDELVGNVSSGKLDGAAGDVTITTKRIGEVAFTMPYITESGVSLLVLSESETIQWTFLEPMTKELWLATVGSIFFTGFVVWLIESPRNPEYQGSVLRQLSTALYFAFSTVTFSHGHIIRSPMSRIVVVTWCFVMLVLMQSYTACFSSNLTAERLRPAVTLEQLLLSHDRVGYQSGSFVYSMLINQGFKKTKLIPYKNEDEYAEALKKGSKGGGVSAIVDEVPYLTAFLSESTYKKEFQIVGHVYNTPGFGFVFNQKICEVAQDLSTAIVDIISGDEGSNNIKEKWLSGTEVATLAITQTDSTALTLQNFSGLFLISGVISCLMLSISIMRLTHAKWTAARDANITAGNEESRQQDATGNTFVPDQPHPEATTTNADYQGADGSGGIVGADGSDVGNSSVRGELPSEATSNENPRAQGTHRSNGSARYEETSAVRNGSVPAQPFEIEINTG